MSRFDECLEFVLDHEGRTTAEASGDINTSFGITQPVYDEWRRARQLPEQNVDLGTPEEFRAIYLERYWVPAKCSDIPAPLDLIHFDSAVNLGLGTANRMLQTALNVGIVDGVIGPRTIGAAKLADPYTIAARYCNLRVTRYIVISQTKPQLKKFLRGWLHRVGDLLKVV